MPYVEAVLWLVSRLAEGLAHSHERGILHRDIKPANVLLTDEGQPMLLDFNLSEMISTRNINALGPRGGTLLYMAPEQLMNFVSEHHQVDERSDIYSLGVLLFQFLTGQLPYHIPHGPLSESLPHLIQARSQSPRSVREQNPSASPAVEAIILRCLDPNPKRRYQSAAQLHEDIQCQLRCRPLKHTPEPSIKERVKKWIRRHPRLSSPSGLGATLLVILAFVVTFAAWNVWRDFHTAKIQARKAALDARAQQQQASTQEQLAKQQLELGPLREEAVQHWQEFRNAALTLRDFQDRLSLAQLLPQQQPFHLHTLKKQIQQCQSLLGRYRVLDSDDWEKHSQVKLLLPSEQKELQQQIGYLTYHFVSARLWEEQVQAREQISTPARWIAGGMNPLGGMIWDSFDSVTNGRIYQLLTLNHRAQQCLAAKKESVALKLQRAALLELTGQFHDAKTLRKQARFIPLTTATDLYLSGLELARNRDFQNAISLLIKATEQRPDQFHNWLLLGVCQQNERDYSSAILSYSHCLALKPNLFWPAYERGMVYYYLGNWKAAEADFTRVLKTDPSIANAYLFRARTRFRDKRTLSAIEDLTRALTYHPNWTTALHLRAEFWESLGDKQRANKDREYILLKEPQTPEEWVYRGLVHLNNNPAKALADINQALAQDSKNRFALLHKAQVLANVCAKPREAMKVLDQAIRYHPNHLDFREKRGFLCAKLGLVTKARHDAEYLLQHAPTSLIRYHVARIYAVLGNYEPVDRAKSIQLLKQALAAGYGRSIIASDEAFAKLRYQKDFRQLVEAVQILEATYP